MKYKVGDKVIIKTWKEMEKEYGLNPAGGINIPKGFYFFMENKLEQLKTNRILTIRYVNCNSNRYSMKEINYKWTDNMIKCLAKDYKEEIYDPIKTRWEILDI